MLRERRRAFPKCATVAGSVLVKLCFVRHWAQAKFTFSCEARGNLTVVERPAVAWNNCGVAITLFICSASDASLSCTLEVTSILMCEISEVECY